METQLKKIFDAHKKTHWLHEYAEDGIVNFNDLQKIVKEFNSIPVEKRVMQKIAGIIDDEIKENKKYYDEKEICWLCYESDHCDHEIKIKTLQELKKKIASNFSA